MREESQSNEINLVVEKANSIKKVIDELKLPNINRKFFHYTSIEVLFSILQNDSIWISNTRFSNDGSETKMLNEYGVYSSDNYMACFCDNGNQLSQWRGYCPEGGASIELELNEVQSYSILHADYENSGKYELVYNTPIPVIYVEDTKDKLKEALDAIQSLCRSMHSDINDDEIAEIIKSTVPFWKNNKFQEEREARLIFSNDEGRFTPCIRFRDLSNKVKVPYMIMKMGDIGLFYRNCKHGIIDIGYIKKLHDNCENALWIPEGSNQEKIFLDVNKMVNQFNTQFEEEESRMRVYCAGHLPIKKITIAPAYDKERIMEQVKRFCQSKYWLRNVEVVCSDIPYIPPFK